MSTKVSALVWYSTIKGSAKRLVLLALADRADDQGFCRPGIKNLTMKTGLADRSVQRACTELESDGLLDRRGRRKVSKSGKVSHDTNAYRINLEALRAIQHPHDDHENQDLADLFDDVVTTPPDTVSPPLPTEAPYPSRHCVTTPPDTVSPNTSLGTSANTSTPSGSCETPTLPTAKGRKSEGEETKLRELKTQHPDAAAFLDALPVGTKAPTTRHLVDMITEIARLAAGGADLEAVRRELLADHRGSGHQYAVMVARAKSYQPQKFHPAGAAPMPFKRRESAAAAADAALEPMDPAERRKKRLELARAAKEEQEQRRTAVA